jgi:hypothetical protein
LTNLQDEKLTSGNEAEGDKSASEEDPTEIESDPDREWESEWQYCKPSLCEQKEKTQPKKQVHLLILQQLPPHAQQRQRQCSNNTNINKPDES